MTKHAPHEGYVLHKKEMIDLVKELAAAKQDSQALAVKSFHMLEARHLLSKDEVGQFTKLVQLTKGKGIDAQSVAMVREFCDDLIKRGVGPTAAGIAHAISDGLSAAEDLAKGEASDSSPVPYSTGGKSVWGAIAAGAAGAAAGAAAGGGVSGAIWGFIAGVVAYLAQ